MSPRQFDYYKELEVSPSAPTSAIIQAYRRLSRYNHPDKFAGDKDAATAKMARLNEARDTLINTEKRQEYDESLNDELDEASRNQVHVSDDEELNHTEQPRGTRAQSGTGDQTDDDGDKGDELKAERLKKRRYRTQARDQTMMNEGEDGWNSDGREDDNSWTPFNEQPEDYYVPSATGEKVHSKPDDPAHWAPVDDDSKVKTAHVSGDFGHGGYKGWEKRHDSSRKNQVILTEPQVQTTVEDEGEEEDLEEEDLEYVDEDKDEVYKHKPLYNADELVEIEAQTDMYSHPGKSLTQILDKLEEEERLWKLKEERNAQPKKSLRQSLAGGLKAVKTRARQQGLLPKHGDALKNSRQLEYSSNTSTATPQQTNAKNKEDDDDMYSLFRSEAGSDADVSAVEVQPTAAKAQDDGNDDDMHSLFRSEADDGVDMADVEVPCAPSYGTKAEVQIIASRKKLRQLTTREKELILRGNCEVYGPVKRLKHHGLRSASVEFASSEACARAISARTKLDKVHDVAVRVMARGRRHMKR